MAEWNLDFYQGEDGYSDGSIEVELLEKLKSGISPEEILKNDSRWPVIYHFSPLRENILNWYPFSEKAEILEVGAGCGALTGLLCRKGGEVTSVELTKIRSEINYERNKQYSNWNLITGNFHNIKFDQTFDYIVLNGVFEYAASFSNDQNPYEYFLRTLKRLLSPKGIILIAIENRLGLKYFNGAREDHTSVIFSGLNKYQGISNVRTFSKYELSNVIENAGFEQYQFYYPGYDYKFPEAIFTDDSINNTNYIAPYHYYELNRAYFFDENSVANAIANENALQSLTNSFLVEINNNNDSHNFKDERTVFVKLSNYRDKKYAICTKIVNDNGVTYVDKEGLNEKAKEHIEQMLANGFLNYGNYQHLPMKRHNNGLRMPFLSGKTFETYLLKLLEQKKIVKVSEEIQELFNDICVDTVINDDFCKQDFIKVFGDTHISEKMHCRKKCNIDLIFSNVFIENSKKYIIDYEWVFDFEIPMEFVIWRALNAFYSNNLIVREYFEKNDLFKIVGLTSKESLASFQAWDEHFQHRYVGTINFDNYRRTTRSLAKAVNELDQKTSVISSLYYDLGEGYNEEQVINVPLSLSTDGTFSIQYTLPLLEKDITHLRWDPCSLPCVITDLEISENLEINAFNDEKAFNDDRTVFLTDDPIYFIEGDFYSDNKIEISGKLHRMSQTDLFKKLGELERIKHIEKDALMQKYEALNIEKEHLEQKYLGIKESAAWKITKPMRMTLDLIKGKKTRND